MEVSLLCLREDEKERRNVKGDQDILVKVYKIYKDKKTELFQLSRINISNVFDCVEIRHWNNPNTFTNHEHIKEDVSDVEISYQQKNRVS